MNITVATALLIAANIFPWIILFVQRKIAFCRRYKCFIKPRERTVNG